MLDCDFTKILDDNEIEWSDKGEADGCVFTKFWVNNEERKLLNDLCVKHDVHIEEGEYEDGVLWAHLYYNVPEEEPSNDPEIKDLILEQDEWKKGVRGNTEGISAVLENEIRVVEEQNEITENYLAEKERWCNMTPSEQEAEMKRDEKFKENVQNNLNSFVDTVTKAHGSDMGDMFKNLIFGRN